MTLNKIINELQLQIDDLHKRVHALENRIKRRPFNKKKLKKQIVVTNDNPLTLTFD